VALVIGEGFYRSVPELANPPNDARDVADALKALGFAVTLGVDLDQARMQRAIDDFARSAATADVSLFYYGGHGLQVAAHNYLIPVDAELRSVDDIDKRTIRLDSVLEGLAKANGIHLVFLDACRNNPLKDLNVALRASGLARVGDAAGFLIAFATQPDNVAYDGAGRNSPFARALLGHVAAPGIDVSSMMIAVRRDVIAATGGAQIPWENSSLTRQFYFAGESAGDSSPEGLLWRLAGGERDPALLSIYLERYPDGAHVADVRTLLGEIGPSAKPSAPSARADVEDLLWRLALSGRESRLLELYLARYPAGAHAREAQALLTSLEDAESAADDPGLVCERLATHPHDETASTPGVELPALRADAAAAIGVCAQAAAAHPEIAHYTALLARAEAAAGRMDEAYALPQGRRRRRRARDVQPRPDARDRRPRAQGPQGGLCALREGGRSRPRRRRDQSRRGAGRGQRRRQEPAARLRAADAGVADRFGARGLRPCRIRRARLRRQDDGRARSLSARRRTRLRQGPSHRRCSTRGAPA
jgi:hypothetical protein